MTKRLREMTSCHVCILPFEDDEDHNICILACGHYGHDICMQKWFVVNPTCPICRQTDITCNHGSTMVCHRKQVLVEIIDHQRMEIKELLHEKQMSQDETLALRTVMEYVTNPIVFLIGE